jgi:hypothetical protein
LNDHTKSAYIMLMEPKKQLNIDCIICDVHQACNTQQN